MSHYRVGSQSAEATEQHFAQVRRELAQADARAREALRHVDERICGGCGNELNALWECDSCAAEKAAPKAWWGI